MKQVIDTGLTAGFSLIRKGVTHVRRAGSLFWTALVAPPLVVLLLVVFLPSMRLLNQAPSIQDENGTAAVLLDSLQQQQAFLEARLALADKDAAGLSLDLVDGVLQVEMQGVPIRRCTMQHVRMNRASAQVMFAGTSTRLFTLEAATATIPHVPVRVVAAPKDSMEAAARPPLDFSTETHDTRIFLHFDQGLTLMIRQPSSSFSEGLRGTLFELKERLDTAGDALAALLQGHLPAHDLRIEVELSGADARAVYRTLSPEAGLALRW